MHHLKLQLHSQVITSLTDMPKLLLIILHHINYAIIDHIVCQVS